MSACESARWITSQKAPLDNLDKEQDFIRLECQLGGVSAYLIGDMMTSLMPPRMTRGCYCQYQIPMGDPVYVWLGYDAYGVPLLLQTAAKPIPVSYTPAVIRYRNTRSGTFT